MLKSVGSIARQFGTISALHFALYRVCQRVMVLDVEHLMLRDASGREHQPSRLPNVSVRSLIADEVQVFAENSETDLSCDMVKRVELENNYCFAAIHENALAGYAWFALESIPPEHNRGSHPATGVGLSFPPHMAYMYKGFILPTYRGNGLYGHIIAGAAKALGEVGVRQLLCNVDWTNYPAIRSCRSVGYRSLGYVWRLGYPRKMLTLPPRDARQLGISFT